MSRSINDGDVVLAGLELPESNVNGDTTFTLGLELVQHPGVFEGTLAHLHINKTFISDSYKLKNVTSNK
jgi:hypothetical protein